MVSKMVRVGKEHSLLHGARRKRSVSTREGYSMTSEQRKQILHDLKKVAEAINKLVRDLDDVGEVVVSDKG